MTKNWLYLSGAKQEEEIREKLENKETIPHKTISGKEVEPTIEERIAIPQSNYNGKVFVLEKIKRKDDSAEFRIGYYIIGKRGRFRDRWAWGQFAPFIPPKDLNRLIKLAKKHFSGWTIEI